MFSSIRDNLGVPMRSTAIFSEQNNEIFSRRNQTVRMEWIPVPFTGKPLEDCATTEEKLLY